LRVVRHDGGIHVCSTIATDHLFADLMAAVGTLSDDGEGPDILPDRGAIDTSTVLRELSLHRALADADRVELDSISMISVRDLGCYATDQSGSWLRVSPPEQRRRLLDAIAG
jgi:hypothetical protein